MVKVRFGLRFRLALLVFLLITVMVLAVGFYVGKKQDDLLLKNVLESAQREIKSAAFLSSRAILDGNDLALVDTLKNLSFTPGFAYAVIHSAEKNVLVSLSQEGLAEDETKFLQEKTEVALGKILEGSDYFFEKFKAIPEGDYYHVGRFLLHPFRKEKTVLGAVQLIFADDFIRKARRENEKALFWAALVLWIFGIASSYTLAHFFIKPVEILSEGVQRVGSGDFDYRLPELGSHEIGILGKQFNLMTQSLKEARKERESQIILQEQIRQAQEIQEGMNPSHFLQTPFYEVKGFTRAARGVGGDYFDFEELPQKQLALLISDVSGKSISASLVMVLIKTVVTTYLRLFQDIRPDKIVSTVNRVLCSQTHVDKFATILFCIFDPITKEITFTNAGHGPLFLYRKKKGVCTVTKLEGLPVGLEEESRYQLAKVKLASGDLLVLYSDGITEAWTKDKKPYGLNRLREKIIEYAPLNAEQIVENIIQDIDSFTKGAEQHDDMTLVVMKVH